MRWFYSSEGDGSKRGLVEQDALFEMAKKGELKPSDLVWQEDSEEGWMPASSVQGLFTGQEKEAAAEPGAQPPAPGAPPETAKAPPPQAKKPLRKVVVALSALAVLMTAAVVITVVVEKLGGEPPEPPPTGPPPEVVRSNRVVQISQDIDTCLEHEDLGRARQLWTEMKEKDDTGLITESYRKRINALQVELSHFMEMQKTLRAGNINDKTIAELVRAYEKRGGNAALLELADSVLADQTALTPPKTVALARLFRALKDADRLRNTLGVFSAIAPTNGPVDTHLEVVKMYTAENMPTNAMQLLEKYLTGESKNTTAWYELGALRCSNGQDDKGMDALKMAVEFGNDDTKRAAIADPRYKSISERWSFRRLTKIKE